MKLPIRDSLVVRKIVKFAPCASDYVTKAYRKVGVKINAFLTSPSFLTSGACGGRGGVDITYWAGYWVGPRTGPNALEKKNPAYAYSRSPVFHFMTQWSRSMTDQY
jgi:hypothetical protein